MRPPLLRRLRAARAPPPLPRTGERKTHRYVTKGKGHHGAFDHPNFLDWSLSEAFYGHI